MTSVHLFGDHAFMSGSWSDTATIATTMTFGSLLLSTATDPMEAAEYVLAEMLEDVIPTVANRIIAWYRSVVGGDDE